MMFDPAKCRDEDLPDGRKSLVYSAATEEIACDYEPAVVSRETALRALKRLVENRA